MKKNLKNEKGITLISLAVTVIIITIITNMLLYNLKDNLKVERLKKMQSDISNLRDKVELYYAEYGEIPANKKIEYTNLDNLRDNGIISTAVDTGKFYVIDLKVLENLTLNYGRDYEKITDSSTEQEINLLTDLYIINEDSCNIFYVEGIKIDNEVFYTDYTKNDKDTEEVELVDVTANVNKPNLKEGMIPVYYDEENKVWKKADVNNKDKQWYDYENKKWANIVTVMESDKELREVEVGTEIPIEKITTFFVWIPRYAYSITSGYKQGNEATGSIDITFLKGDTNIGVDGKKYETDYDETKLNPGDITPKIVHPAFTLGDKQLTGIWVAKFEASGINKDGLAAGNASSTSSKPTSTEGAYVRILPSQISWRHITIGESEYQSMLMSTNTEKYGWTSEVNSHLIKNNEWGAVAYLCYSKYGNVPETNGAGIRASGGYYYNIYTGAGVKGVNDNGSYSNFTEETHGYNTELGVLASTTGNVYGIYDMKGGSWERVATYFDNENGNLDKLGISTTNEDIKYFENGKLNSQYSSLWDAYKVSEEEKNNRIQVEGVGEISQLTLWNWNNRSQEYNEARLRLTRFNFENMPKGIGGTETTTQFSYYAPYGSTSGKYGWFRTPKDTEDDITQEYGRTWDSSVFLMGYSSIPFIARGSGFNNGSNGGILYSKCSTGLANYDYGFRPVLAF